MKLTVVERSAIPSKLRESTKLRALIAEFEAMNVECVEAEWEGEYSSATSASGTLRAAIKRMHKSGHIKVEVRNKKIYLINEAVVGGGESEI